MLRPIFAVTGTIQRSDAVPSKGLEIVPARVLGAPLQRGRTAEHRLRMRPMNGKTLTRRLSQWAGVPTRPDGARPASTVTQKADIRQPCSPPSSQMIKMIGSGIPSSHKSNPRPIFHLSGRPSAMTCLRIVCSSWATLSEFSGRRRARQRSCSLFATPLSFHWPLSHDTEAAALHTRHPL
jgi:hypothetical protein